MSGAQDTKAQATWMEGVRSGLSPPVRAVKPGVDTTRSPAPQSAQLSVTMKVRLLTADRQARQGMRQWAGRRRIPPREHRAALPHARCGGGCDGAAAGPHRSCRALPAAWRRRRLPRSPSAPSQAASTHHSDTHTPQGWPEP